MKIDQPLNSLSRSNALTYDLKHDRGGSSSGRDVNGKGAHAGARGNGASPASSVAASAEGIAVKARQDDDAQRPGPQKDDSGSGPHGIIKKISVYA